ncbi:MAG: ATP-binding protein [Candidatus Enteromonas sp.]|nr:ATP-binding protein [Candidatus Enteromonas sp.]
MLMKRILRESYLNQLIAKQKNGLVKILTGIRRGGKSFLLDPIFREYLLSQGVSESHIIKIDFDERRNKAFLDPDVLDEYIRGLIVDGETYYLLFDEIQKVDDFESVLNGFLHIGNVDIFVTGSNSKFLSSDIVTEFRGRGDEIRVFPLSFSEFLSVFEGSKEEAWEEYITYGGLPKVPSFESEIDKAKYLKQLFEQTYLSDIVERNDIQRVDVLDAIVNMLASSIGSLTNPNKLFKTFQSSGEKGLSINTISSYLAYLEDSFLVHKAERYDVKGKKYIQSPFKYYFSDIGLRNARLNFRQQEETHIMENIIYNELLARGHNVDVGVVNIREGDAKKQVEVDFVCNQGNRKYYIQSALSLPTREKTFQEERPLLNIPDNFKKIIVVKESQKRWITEEGICVIGILDFLLDKNSLES